MALVVNTTLVPLKSTRTSIGVQVVNLKRGDMLESAVDVASMQKKPLSKYKKAKIPSAGIVFNEIDIEENQTSLL